MQWFFVAPKLFFGVLNYICLGFEKYVFYTDSSISEYMLDLD